MQKREMWRSSKCYLLLSLLSATHDSPFITLLLNAEDLSMSRVMAMGSKTSDDLGWLGYLILGVWIINGVLVSFLLTRIDLIVNGQLYGYGLEFSQEWAETYSMSLNLIYVFIAVPIALSSIVLALALRMRKRRVGYLIRRKKEPEMEVFVKVPETKVECEAETEQALARQPEKTSVTEEPHVEQ